MQMKLFNAILEKLRALDKNHGYSCDFCGREIFNYPQKRVCAPCERTFQKPSKYSCEKCGRVTFSQGVCLTCKREMPSFTRGFSAFCYQGQVPALINRFKNGKLRLGFYLGEEICKAVANADIMQTLSSEKILCVPVPLTKEKLKERGYNQAEVLARQIAEEFSKCGVQVCVETDILQKVKQTPRQKDLDFQQRKSNLAGAFHVHKRSACNDATIFLVDDILTTGATGNECAERLLKAGAKAVYFLTAAALPEERILNLQQAD